MSVREDVEKILAAGKLIEEMEAKYENELLDFGREVRLFHQPTSVFQPCLHAYRYLAEHNSTLTLSPASCTSEHIVFTDYDEDEYRLPIGWLEDREAWHAKAAEQEAAYQAQQLAEKASRKDARISELKKELSRLEGQA